MPHGCSMLTHVAFKARTRIRGWKANMFEVVKKFKYFFNLIIFPMFKIKEENEYY